MDIRGLSIRRASAGDLPALARAFGQHHYFADRVRRQEAERGVLLLAWLRGVPVGDLYVWWERPEEPEIAERLPDVPLLNHLEVGPPYRNKGIGTRILLAAETLLIHRGHERVALGVEPSNEDAIRLYERLGYARWPYPDVPTTYEEFLDDGRRLRHPDSCAVFVKELSTKRRASSAPR